MGAALGKATTHASRCQGAQLFVVAGKHGEGSAVRENLGMTCDRPPGNFASGSVREAEGFAAREAVKEHRRVAQLLSLA
jgi:hypothetical protein